MEKLTEDQYIKDILVKIQVINPEAFDRFASEHSICFQKGNGNWLFPMMYDYYVNKWANEEIISLLNKLGVFLHNQCMKKDLYEITAIDRSLCIDDSYVDEYVVEIQHAQNEKPIFKDINSPWRTRGISLALHEIPTISLNSIVFKYKDYNHPYILADIAGMLIYGQKLIEGLHYLYRSVKEIVNFPNRFWNSDYGIVGAANTFRLLYLMCPSSNIELTRKLFKYQYVYLTKLSCTTNDELFQQEAFVNRASIVISSSARFFIPMNINPDLLYISDMYYAHYCNELAEQLSYASGWKYNMKSLTYYQHASFWPNDTGGYADIEDKTYNEIVSQKHEQAKFIAFEYFLGFQSQSDFLNHNDIEELFKLIQHECRYNFKSLRNKVLNYKSYK